MKISGELAIKILEYLEKNKSFYFPFLVMCKNYTEEYGEFLEIKSDEWELIKKNKKYQTFELWENLQNLNKKTLELMAKGFLEEITKKNEDIKSSFIFYTTEGFTFQSNSEDEMTDVENCQILGWGKGTSPKKAFADFRKESPWIKNLRFDRVVGVELKDEKTYYFNLEK